MPKSELRKKKPRMRLKDTVYGLQILPFAGSF